MGEKCRVCKKFISGDRDMSYLDCARKHYYHLDCLEEIKKSLKIYADCEDCIKEVFSKIIGIRKCAKCENPLKHSEICPTYKILCMKCRFSLFQSANQPKYRSAYQFKHQSEKHATTCEPCKIYKEIHFKFCFRCQEIFDPAKLFLTPLCKDHFFCEECLNMPPKNPLDQCGNCASYFNTISKNSLKPNCNLCGKFSEPFSCQVHDYCKFCKDAILKYGLNVYKRVENCQDCVQIFSEIKSHSEKLWKLENEEKKLTSSTSMMQISPKKSKNLLQTVNSSSRLLAAKPEEFKVTTSKNFKTAEKYSRNPVPIEKILPSTPQNLSNSVVCAYCHSNATEQQPCCSQFFCVNCILLKCINDILQFECSLSIKDLSKLSSKFSYICFCKNPFNFPTNLLIKNIIYLIEKNGINFIQNRQMYEDFFKKFYEKIPRFYKFSPYFDGIKGGITNCPCGELCVKIGKISLCLNH